MGENDNAVLDFTAARDNFPNDAKLRGLLAVCLLRIGRTAESLKEFTASLELDPFMKETLLARGNTFSAIHEYEKSSYFLVMTIDEIINEFYTCIRII
jgi:Flp pilus assembly protein TadD